MKSEANRATDFIQVKLLDEELHPYGLNYRFESRPAARRANKFIRQATNLTRENRKNE